ncbi:nuclease SbcCD subunit D [Virgisporangium aliadipatigenens]|uniref:Nuclease SbcCD subunit D n=1 Tax=Virgisporangium aliadipatigenens TaxID=741659 RepID=A0A8J3YN84_9ACTN|nr:exonuclease SbcCD subunit D [Virgisporangium aliadipatigenens]GIJ46985.1 nuclease SbcCD subunit D [Virgisporangium aliadipatigenens]
MKILHTSDWHVGKVLKGRPRLDEQIQVLAQVVEVARDERPDLIIVAGDLYDTAAPTADATRVVTRALSALRRTGAELVAIGGNHDNGPALDALRPWAESAGITLRGAVRESVKEHVITGTTAGGEEWRMIALPFLSQRYAVRAVEMFKLTDAEATQTYADHVARLLSVLAAEAFADDTINLVTTHLTVVGGAMGGGERDAHTILGYAVPATVFPGNAHYVALGHLHRAQTVPGPCPVRYSGSPLAIDFGEAENTPSVSVVDVSADRTAKVRDVPITAATPLKTVFGTLEQLAALDAGEAWLRVFVREAPRAGLREEVQEMLPRALEVRIDPMMLPEAAATRPSARAAGRSAGELFTEYLAGKGHDDPATRDLFHRLHGEVS